MSLSVLLISDDPSVTDLLPTVLSRSRMDVKVITSVEAALQRITGEPPHIAIVDLAATEREGREACRAIRLAGTVPVLVLSALNDPAVVARLLDAGADDYLVKPVPFSVLIAHLKKLARRTGALDVEQSARSALLQDTQPLSP